MRELPADGVLLFGGSGHTGSILAKRLCQAGRKVIVMLRSPVRRADFEAMGCWTVIGDALNRDSIMSITREATDCAIAISLLGGAPFNPPQSWPDAIGNINVIDACEQNGISRLILVTSIGTGSSSQFVPPELFTKPLLAQKEKAENHLRKSRLNWTIIKPGGLAQPGTDVYTEETLVTENPGVRGLIDRRNLVSTIERVIDNKRTWGKELHAVGQLQESNEGKPVPFAFDD